jgi:AcrR family transcriptional regulator
MPHAHALHEVESSGGIETVTQVRRPRRSHAERREEAERSMLDAAVRIVAERGLEHLTLAECGEAAGYSRGLAAHYFGTKDTLIVAIANHIVADYTRSARGGSRGRKGLDGLSSAVEFYIDNGRNSALKLRAFNAVLAAGPTHPDLTKAIAKLNRESASNFERGLRACIKQGEVRADIDVRAQSRMLVAMLRGVLTQWLLDPEGVDLDALKKEVVTSLRRALARCSSI